jgi:hypothetical protein
MPHECFADEIAIDFPSVDLAVERMRDAFLGARGSDDAADVVRRHVFLSRREAVDGVVVPVEVPIAGLCRHCGGRGEVWTERCHACDGAGSSVHHHAVRVSVPPRVADGACFRFRVTPPEADSVRVEIRVAITNRVGRS